VNQVSSNKTIVPVTPSRPPTSISPPVVQPVGQSPKPHLEKKTSAIGKLFHHKATPTGSANASTTSLGRAAGPPPAKSAGTGTAAGTRSPNVHSGDESDTHSETSTTSSAGGALRAFGRRMSSNTKPAQPKAEGAAADTGKLDRRPSNKKAPSEADVTGKLERKSSVKEGKGDGHMTLKEYVAAHSGGIMSRKPSATRCVASSSLQGHILTL
jgi:hypothetical protein